MPNPTRLTGNQLIILNTAAERKDGAVLPLPEDLDLTGQARTIVLKSLLDRGLIESIPESMKPNVRWKEEAINFRITRNGRRFLKAAKARVTR